MSFLFSHSFAPSLSCFPISFVHPLRSKRVSVMLCIIVQIVFLQIHCYIFYGLSIVSLMPFTFGKNIYQAHTKIIIYNPLLRLLFLFLCWCFSFLLVFLFYFHLFFRWISVWFNVCIKLTFYWMEYSLLSQSQSMTLKKYRIVCAVWKKFHAWLPTDKKSIRNDRLKSIAIVSRHSWNCQL